MLKSFRVYIHTLPNGKRYIGITTQKPEHRWGHQGNGYKENRRFFNAIKKYGWDNIKHEVVAEGLDKEEACREEQRLIKLYRTSERNFGYNYTLGGDHYEFSEEAKQKMRKPKKLTDEQREMLRARGRLAYERYLRDRKNTPEARLKMSMTKRGVKQDPKLVAKRTAALKKHWEEVGGFSKEHREKLSKAMKGRTYSEETLRRMKEAHCTEKNKRSRKVAKLMNGEIIQTFLSVRQAGRETGIDYTTIVRACAGKLKHAGGYEWRYL